MPRCWKSHVAAHINIGHTITLILVYYLICMCPHQTIILPCFNFLLGIFYSWYRLTTVKHKIIYEILSHVWNSLCRSEARLSRHRVAGALISNTSFKLLVQFACARTYADLESFVRGGPTAILTTFYKGREDPNTTKSGPSSKWRFAGVPMMSQH